ncbi:hypothetical protein [Pseudosulfitobacter pseudonitzschiae]|uniref:hypothetical protein n=1 Tax=Pseudosulfitobacter pseudonitzschiae TaxID=1402135 RepID=UPI003B77941C
MNKTRRLEMRYAWIEASLRYSGRFDKTSYGQYHNINAPQISADQADFVRAFNYQQSYLERQAGVSQPAPFLGVEKGKISILRELPMETVFDVPGIREWLRTLSTVPYVEALEYSVVDPDPSTFREICNLVMQSKASSILYMDQPDETGEHDISPHSILDVGGELSVRAFDHGEDRFRDFLISAIISVGRPSRNIKYRSSDSDIDWSEEVEVLLASSSLLSNTEATMVSSRSNTAAGDLRVVSVPRALRRYLGAVTLENS